MPLLQYGEWKPDVADYEGTTTKSILNVVPRGDGYGPFPDFTAATHGLPSACRGGFYALNADGSVSIFAGTVNRLYRLNNTDYTWIEVSKGGDAYSDLSGPAQWRFAQTGSLVFATQANAALQVFNLVSDSDFSDALGAPPQAAYIDVVGQFLVLSGLLSQPFRIQWSGLAGFNGADSWTPGVNSSDFQDFPDGGVVRGVAGGEFGTIFQDQAIRRMSYIPGSPLVFQIDRVAQDEGLFAPYSIIRSGATVFFYSGQGFKKIDPGGYPTPIGRERVDRTFIDDLDRGSLQLFMGCADPRSSRVYWAYKSLDGEGGRYDKILGYDKVLDRFFPIAMRGECLLSISQTGLTLENLDAISSSIDAMTLTLDSYPTASQPEISQFGADHDLGFFRGENLEATVETSEQGTDGQRIFVRGFRPITDAPTLFGSLSYRETQGDPISTTLESPRFARTGRVDLRRSTRYARFHVRIPAGTNWTFNAGVEPDVVPEGMQ